ncbi:MAG TPA: protein translocase subunit SecF [Allosphingosinicella sp.]|nr:protein translocase subunit SecF [Allosphingosinicella sp.]
MRLLKLVPDNTNIDFVRLRGWAFGLTALLTVIAVFATVTKGLNLGVDFVGGLSVEATFKQAPDVGDLRSLVDRQGQGEAVISPYLDNPKVVSIRLPSPKSNDPGATNAVVGKVQAAVLSRYKGVTFGKTDSVSAKVSGELIRNGVIAVLLAVFAIAIWGWFRFEWQFGLSTFVSIGHDVLMTLGFFAVWRMEFDLTIVAAVLTVVSYSVNDKIVIDDRIRENMRKYRQMDMRGIVNLSVNETLPRTVMTSLTVLLALGSLLFFGGHVLRGFTAAMIIGVIVGTYSSIYVSSSLLIVLGLKPQPLAAPKVKGVASGAERITREGY